MNELGYIPTERQKISQLVMGNARTLMIVFILFTVVVVMTTDISLVTITDITDLGLDFFLILFNSYAMYICCADGGIKSGYTTDAYKACIERFDELKAKVEESMLPRMGEFCNYYCDEELRKTRMQYLSVACIPYEDYLSKYATLGNKEIKALTELTEPQKKAVITANNTQRIKLTPDMIMTQGKTVHTRSPLMISPQAVKNIAFGVKIMKMSFVSVCMSLIALDVILEPSWAVFAQVCLKLATVVINGFDGHKEGFNNITIHTVNYVNAQTALMRQAIQYIEEHPITTTKE